MKKLLMSLSLTLAMSNTVFASTDTPVDFPQNLIFVSPHPDDILLTFAGLIDNNDGFTKHNISHSVIFTLSQWTENANPKDLSDNRITKVSMQRYVEENAAVNEMFRYKARIETYGYPDAPIRHYEGPKTLGGAPAGNFSTFRAQEISIYEQLVPVFENKLQTPNCAMFVLMANGSHIDHFIVREAVITAVRRLGSKASCKIYFGEGQPYTGIDPKGSMKQMTAIQQRLNLQKIPYNIDHGKKIAAFAKHYISQYSDDYGVGINKWAEINGGKEDLYYWDPKYYNNKNTIEPSCTKEFCK